MYFSTEDKKEEKLMSGPTTFSTKGDEKNA